LKEAVAAYLNVLHRHS